jgi:tetratricopeptide (TPR) repeat protein
MTIKSKPYYHFLCLGCLVMSALLCSLRPSWAADTNVPPAANAKTADADIMGAQDFLHSYLQLQEQLRDTQLAIQKIRQEAAAASASNSAVVEERLRLMEKTIATENSEQLNGMERLNRTILSAAGVFASVAFLVLLVAICLQWAAVNRLAAATNLAASRSARLPDPAEALLPSTHALEQSNIRFLALMDQLELRLRGLEESTKPVKSLVEGETADGSAVEKPAPGLPDKTSTVTLLLSKSQTLLKLGQPEAALDCLDEVLALDPGNADALVKKGAALEHLQRVSEAIECYDRAIAQDASMTMAYLHKGTLFTRLERHGEALACYEQALKPSKARREKGAPDQPVELAHQ